MFSRAIVLAIAALAAVSSIGTAADPGGLQSRPDWWNDPDGCTVILVYHFSDSTWPPVPVDSLSYLPAWYEGTEWSREGDWQWQDSAWTCVSDSGSITIHVDNFEMPDSYKEFHYSYGGPFGGRPSRPWEAMAVPAGCVPMFDICQDWINGTWGHSCWGRITPQPAWEALTVRFYAGTRWSGLSFGTHCVNCNPTERTSWGLLKALYRG